MGFLSNLNPFGGGSNNTQSSGGILNKEQVNQSTSQTTSVGASDSSFAIGTATTVNSLDGGAIAGSLDLAGEAIAHTATILDYYQKQNKESLTTLAQFATESNKEGVQQLTESVFKYGVWGLVAIGATVALTAALSGKKQKAA